MLFLFLFPVLIFQQTSLLLYVWSSQVRSGLAYVSGLLKWRPDALHNAQLTRNYRGFQNIEHYWQEITEIYVSLITKNKYVVKKY